MPINFFNDKVRLSRSSLPEGLCYVYIHAILNHSELLNLLCCEKICGKYLIFHQLKILELSFISQDNQSFYLFLKAFTWSFDASTSKMPSTYLSYTLGLNARNLLSIHFCNDKVRISRSSLLEKISNAKDHKIPHSIGIELKTLETVNDSQDSQSFYLFIKAFSVTSFFWNPFYWSKRRKTFYNV